MNKAFDDEFGRCSAVPARVQRHGPDKRASEFWMFPNPTVPCSDVKLNTSCATPWRRQCNLGQANTMHGGEYAQQMNPPISECRPEGFRCGDH